MRRYPREKGVIGRGGGGRCGPKKTIEQRTSVAQARNGRHGPTTGGILYRRGVFRLDREVPVFSVMGNFHVHRD